MLRSDKDTFVRAGGCRKGRPTNCRTTQLGRNINVTGCFIGVRERAPNFVFYSFITQLFLFLIRLQLSEQRKQLKEEFGIDLRVLGIASSQKMMLKETGIDLDTWKQDFDTKVRPL